MAMRGLKDISRNLFQISNFSSLATQNLLNHWKAFTVSNTHSSRSLVTSILPNTQPILPQANQIQHIHGQIMARVKYSTKGHEQRSLVKKATIVQIERAQVARSHTKSLSPAKHNLRPRRNGKVINAEVLALLIASPSPEPAWMPADRIPARKSKKRFGDESREDLTNFEAELRAEFKSIAENPTRERQGKGFLKNSVNQSLWKSIEPRDPNINAVPERYARSPSPRPTNSTSSTPSRDSPPPSRRARAKTPFPGRDSGSIPARPSISPITPPPALSSGKAGSKRQREDDEEEGDWDEFEREVMAELAKENEKETRKTKKARR